MPRYLARSIEVPLDHEVVREGLTGLVVNDAGGVRLLVDEHEIGFAAVLVVHGR